jgi:hypothetical protein
MTVDSQMEWCVLDEEQVRSARPWPFWGVLFERSELWRALRTGESVFFPSRQPYTLSSLYHAAKRRRCRISMQQAMVDGVRGTIVVVVEDRDAGFSQMRLLRRGEAES